MARNGPGGSQNLTTVRALVVASQFGFTLAVAVGVGLVAGRWLDDRFGTGFIFTLIGALLGLASGVLAAVRTYRVATQPIPTEEHQRATPPAPHLADEDHMTTTRTDRP